MQRKIIYPRFHVEYQDTAFTNLQLGHLAHFYPKRLTSFNTHIDTPTSESTMQGDSQLVRSS